MAASRRTPDAWRSVELLTVNSGPGLDNRSTLQACPFHSTVTDFAKFRG